MRYFWVFLFISSFLFLYSCKNRGKLGVEPERKLMEIPKGFPLISFPEDNAYSIERWTLGKKLFHDKALSLNYSVSCASCHKSELAFSDNVALSIGEHNLLGTSNSPTLTNIAYHPYFTRAGGVPTLEMQVLVPIQEHNEFDFNIVELANRLSSDFTYQEMANKAYHRKIDAYVITRAIANYERSFISGSSRYDKYKNGDKKALSQAEIDGMNLFFSTKTNCANCHSGIQFSDFSFKNNGLYEVYPDSGRMRVTELESDRALYKVPTLRNVSVTAPYMHDGAFQTLEEVVNHYNSGGKNHINQSEWVKPLSLTKEEMQSLVAFLHTLTDKQFLEDKYFSP